ncbi:hypothetical protein D0Z03_002641 [Geotrichum reessii]|nr:hypothetical protein D0Z03_002641 [Galactomyces reessii]
MENELEEIKAEQGQLAAQYTAVAKSLISSKSHRLSTMIQALKKGEKLTVFENIYRSQTAAHEKRLRRANKQRDYEKYSVHKVAIGEVDNVWLQFYENKQKLRERMIHDINERICDIQREFYMRAERDKRVSDPKTLVKSMRLVAANLGPVPKLSELRPDEIENDLACLRSGLDSGSESSGTTTTTTTSAVTNVSHQLNNNTFVVDQENTAATQDASTASGNIKSEHGLSNRNSHNYNKNFNNNRNNNRNNNNRNNINSHNSCNNHSSLNRHYHHHNNNGTIIINIISSHNNSNTYNIFLHPRLFF